MSLCREKKLANISGQRIVAFSHRVVTKLLSLAFEKYPAKRGFPKRALTHVFAAAAQI